MLVSALRFGPALPTSIGACLLQLHEVYALCSPNAAVITTWTFTAVPVVSGANVTATKYWTPGDPAQVGWRDYQCCRFSLCLNLWHC